MLSVVTGRPSKVSSPSVSLPAWPSALAATQPKSAPSLSLVMASSAAGRLLKARLRSFTISGEE